MKFNNRRKVIVLGLIIASSLYFGGKMVRAQEQNSVSLSEVSITPTEIPGNGEAGYFLKIEGVDGESKDQKHKNEIDIASFSWGETNSASSFGAGGSGKVQMQDFHFVMKYNKASPKLFLACASGEHFPDATLRLARKSADDQLEYLKWKLTDVMCTSYQTGGSNPEVPTDSFSLNFAKIEVEYKAQKADGTLDAPVKAGWDVQKNKKF